MADCTRVKGLSTLLGTGQLSGSSFGLLACPKPSAAHQPQQDAVLQWPRLATSHTSPQACYQQLQQLARRSQLVSSESHA